MVSEYAGVVSFVVAAVYLVAIANIPLAIKNSRTPQGATAWSVALISFPFLTVPLYWIFGRSKFHGYVNAHRNMNEQVRQRTREVMARIEAEATPAPERLKPLCDLVHKLTELPFTRGNAVDLLIDGEQTFTSILSAIGEAQNYILIQFYIYRDDDIGRKIKDALIERAKAGVRVYFMYDEIGSPRLPQKFLAELRQHGIEETGFKTTKGRGNRFQINFRNHRKLVVVDGHTAFVGGLNVGDDYLGLYPKVGPWRDTHVKIKGPAVQIAQVSFVKDWYWPTEAILDLNWHPQSAGGKSHVTVAHTGPADTATVATMYHLEAFNAAQSRIWIANPYFVPDEPTAKALEIAALRGIDVRIILPANNDNRFVQLAAMTYVQQLLPAGVKFYLYKKGQQGFLHQKVFLIDDQISAIGTTNLDNRSLHINFECSALIIDSEFACQVEKMLLDDFAQSTPLEKSEVEAWPHWYRLATKTANLAAPLL
jgi:cardiolipin synthase